MEHKLVDNLKLTKGGGVLDLGCGEGDVLTTVTNLTGSSGVGLDINPKTIKTAKRKNPQHNYTVGSYEKNLGFQNLTAAYTMETLVHSANPEKVLTNVYQYLKTDGRLVLFEYAHTPMSTWSSKQQENFTQICENSYMPGWLKFQDDMLPKLLASSGFTVDSIEDYSKNILPLLGFFYKGAIKTKTIHAYIPPALKVNAESAIFFWENQDLWSYKVYAARKG